MRMSLSSLIKSILKKHRNPLLPLLQSPSLLLQRLDLLVILLCQVEPLIQYQLLMVEKMPTSPQIPMQLLMELLLIRLLPQLEEQLEPPELQTLHLLLEKLILQH